MNMDMHGFIAFIFIKWKIHTHTGHHSAIHECTHFLRKRRWITGQRKVWICEYIMIVVWRLPEKNNTHTKHTRMKGVILYFCCLLLFWLSFPPFDIPSTCYAFPFARHRPDTIHGEPSARRDAYAVIPFSMLVAEHQISSPIAFYFTFSPFYHLLRSNCRCLPCCLPY